MNDISAEDILETVQNGLLILHDDLTIASANRAFYLLFQTSADETIGRLLFELGDGQWDIPRLRELLEAIIPQERTVEGFEIEHDFPGVGRKIMRLNGRKVFRPGNNVTLFLLAIEDVTVARDERREAERHWLLAQNIVDTIRDPLVILESDMRVALASPSFLRMFGTTADQVVGRPLADLGQGQWDVKALRTLLDRVVPDDESFDGLLLDDEFPGMGRRIFKLNARRIYRPGDDVSRLLLVFEDVTEATLIDRHRDVLAAELAHRIKNSLQVIAAFVAFEIRQAADPCVAGYRAMQARIGAVAELYDVIARSSAFGPVAVEDYLEGIASSLRSSLLGHDSKIEVAVDAEPLSILADHAVPLGLIVNELATNAVKYAFPAGAGCITLGFRHRDGEVALTVSDTGAGIGSGASGSGMGTRFVEAFVKQLGGSLATTSATSGTTFTVRLPVSVLAADG